MRKFLTLWLYVFGLLASITTVPAGSMSLLGAKGTPAFVQFCEQFLFN